MKKYIKAISTILLLSSCTYLSQGAGQVVFHWEKPNTGIQAFSRDHKFCMNQSQDFSFIPDFRTWFYSEESKLNIRVKWDSEKGIWASYIAYPGAMPVLVNYLQDDEDINPYEYKDCMEDLGYLTRYYERPEITNINVQQKYLYRDPSYRN